jgi:hypothetical protein
MCEINASEQKVYFIISDDDRNHLPPMNAVVYAEVESIASKFVNH